MLSQWDFTHIFPGWKVIDINVIKTYRCRELDQWINGTLIIQSNSPHEIRHIILIQVVVSIIFYVHTCGR